jgi:hypothetical protein
MAVLSPVQLAGIMGLRREFKAAKNTHGPLRCVLIHKDGENERLALSPPYQEDMPALALWQKTLYSYRLHSQCPGEKKIPHKPATIGTSRNPYYEPGEPAKRPESFASRDIYLLRNYKEIPPSWPSDPKVLLANPNWQKLLERTHESQERFWRLADEAGKCFGANDCAVLPEVARESLEARGDGSRWLWIVFDLAWQKVPGSPLRADRQIWHQTKDEGTYYFPLDYDFAKDKDSSFPKAWAKRRPEFYYSSLDDLFSASVSAIDLLIHHKADTAQLAETPAARITRLEAESNTVCGQISSMQDAMKGKLPEPGTSARDEWDNLGNEYQRLAVELRNARQCPNPKDPAELLIFIEFKMEYLKLTGPEANRVNDRHVRFDHVGRTYTILEAAFVVYTQAYEHAKAMKKATPSLPQLPPRKECFKDNLEAIAAFNALRDWCDGNAGLQKLLPATVEAQAGSIQAGHSIVAGGSILATGNIQAGGNVHVNVYAGQQSSSDAAQQLQTLRFINLRLVVLAVSLCAVVMCALLWGVDGNWWQKTIGAVSALSAIVSLFFNVKKLLRR